MKNKKSQKLWFNGIIAFGVLFVIAAVVFRVFDIDVLPSQLYGALLGTVITAIITVFLLNGQSENEMKREKDSKVFENKIRVYSEFADKMWGMYADEEITEQEITELRLLCFKSLVFYLDDEQVKMMTAEVQRFNPNSSIDTLNAIASITKLLQDNLNGSEQIHVENLKKLYGSFTNKIASQNDDVIVASNSGSTSLEHSHSGADKQSDFASSYWHFNMLDVQKQLLAIKSKKYFLALIEYGEEWRSNAVKRVNAGDIVFLFQRGGPGYVGAFRVIEPRVHIVESVSKDESSPERILMRKDDLYGGVDDGATHVSGLQVEPIAFNYKGVGYPSVRRRTIERMNEESAKWLINKFKGNDLPKGHESGIGYIDAETKIECVHANMIS